MTKVQADKIVLQYKDKIYGFALSKTKDYDQAQELSSQIICEVYMSLLKSNNIVNLDGYVYRLSSNVYAKFVHGLIEGRKLSSIDVAGGEGTKELAVEDRYFYDDNQKELELLKKEIGYLSDRQRSIVYLYYYQNMKVQQIAKALNVSESTVKWHLFDARNTLKEVMIMNYETETIDTNQAINPIKFTDMGHYGSPGKDNSDTYTMFNSRLKQNIAWSCYWEPKTFTEIARTVGVPIAYVQDELQKLVAYGYIDAIDSTKNPKFRTNMIIFDDRHDRSEKHKFDLSFNFKEIAKKLCESYFPALFDDFEKDPSHWGMSCIDNDLNFMKYSLVMITIKYLNFSNEQWKIDNLKVARPDGGNFIAISTVADDISSGEPLDYDYWICGYMTNGFEDCNSVQIQCKYTDRPQNWRENMFTEPLNKFIKSNCNPDALKLEEYELLRKSGMIYDNKVQCVLMEGKANNIWNQVGTHMDKFKDVINSLKDYSKEIDNKMWEAMKNAFPEQAQEFIRLTYACDEIGSQNVIPFVIEEMLSNGMLKELSPVQKKAAMYILSK